MCANRGVQALASLGHPGRRRVVLGHTLNMQTPTETDEQKKVLSEFMMLCWAAFVATLSRPRAGGWTALGKRFKLI